ncbi:MAG: hypothetical protein KKB50_07035 [Planctomycetes bacterium]|nr:hypothetical protein [Planctomycetota bacterium]
MTSCTWITVGRQTDSRRRTLASAIVAALVLALVAAGRAQEPAPAERVQDPDEIKTVRVTAEGFNRDDALKQALRKALEQGAGLQLASFTEVENFALARDTIYSRASGVVREYRIIEEKPGPQGTYEMTVEATVRSSVVAAAWGEVQNVLDQIGRPRIMVWIDERIDERPQEHSIVAARIEELFVKAGFDLVEQKAVEEIRRREATDARDGQDAAKLARLAKDAGAHILIRGSANANRAGLEDLYGVPAAFYNCDALAKVYHTDTGKLLASESVPLTRRGVRSRREFSPQAARVALVEATFPPPNSPRRTPALALKLFDSIMEQWATQISAGGDIELEIERLDFKTYLEIKRALPGIERVQSVHGDFTKGTGLFRIKALMSAETLAELLTEKPFDDWLAVTDLKSNRIQARHVGKP